MFDLKSDIKKSVDDKVAEITQSINCRLELIETVFASLQKRKFINSEIELVPIERKKIIEKIKFI